MSTLCYFMRLLPGWSKLNCPFRALVFCSEGQYPVETILTEDDHLPLMMVDLILAKKLHDLPTNGWLKKIKTGLYSWVHICTKSKFQLSVGGHYTQVGNQSWSFFFYVKKKKIPDLNYFQCIWFCSCVLNVENITGILCFLFVTKVLCKVVYKM